jgi:DnaK suppressor protein
VKQSGAGALVCSLGRLNHWRAGLGPAKLFSTEDAVKVQQYKRRLLGIEAQISARMGRDTRSAREQVDDSPGDAGDASVADVAASDRFTEAELDATVLEQVQDALKRIDEGTFGKCVIDGGPIEAKRLDAVPWTPYCLKHQSLFEAAGQPRGFTA